eukprot:6192095-Pleurochrysis_carterae.AAC.4
MFVFGRLCVILVSFCCCCWRVASFVTILRFARSRRLLPLERVPIANNRPYYERVSVTYFRGTFAAQKRHDVRRSVTDASAADSGADAQIRRLSSGSEACTIDNSVYNCIMYIDGFKLLWRRF